jgi:hypothetical protein
VTVTRWFDHGKIPGAYLVPGSKDRRFPIDAVRVFIRENNITAREKYLGKYILNVLLVSPDESLCCAMRSHVEGYELRHVCDLFEAGYVVSNSTPSVVVIDDRIGTIETQQLIRSLRDWSATSIVVVSESNAMRYSDHITIDRLDPLAIADKINELLP